MFFDSKGEPWLPRGSEAVYYGAVTIVVTCHINIPCRLDQNKLTCTPLITRDERGKEERPVSSRVSRVSLQLVPPQYKMSRWFSNLLTANVMFTFFTFVLASNGLLTDLLGSGAALNDEPFWMEKIKHQGISPFNANATDYKVFRNVKVSNRIVCAFIPCSTILLGLWRNW